MAVQSSKTFKMLLLSQKWFNLAQTFQNPRTLYGDNKVTFWILDFWIFFVDISKNVPKNWKNVDFGQKCWRKHYKKLKNQKSEMKLCLHHKVLGFWKVWAKLDHFSQSSSILTILLLIFHTNPYIFSIIFVLTLNTHKIFGFGFIWLFWYPNLTKVMKSYLCHCRISAF